MLLTVHPCEHSISLVLISNCGSLIAVALLLSNKFLLKSFASVPLAILSTNMLPIKLLFESPSTTVFISMSLILSFSK